MSFRSSVEGKSPSWEALLSFLKTNGEWVGCEYKTAGALPDFGLREAVCALANTDGGDVFLGVNNDGVPVGSLVNEDAVSDLLRKEGPSGDPRFETNLLSFTPFGILPFKGPAGESVLCVEVVPSGVPCLIRTDDGSLEMRRRKGRSTEKMDARQVIERFTAMGRARMFREIYTEARLLLRQARQTHEELDPGPSMPRFEELYKNGTWSTFARTGPAPISDDNNLLLSGQVIGLCRGYRDFWVSNNREPDRVRRWNALHQQRVAIDNALRTFRTTLEGEHIALPE